MNISNILAVADVLDNPPADEHPRFHMGNWGFEVPIVPTCQTAACIAGHAVWLLRPKTWNRLASRLMIPELAQELFDLTGPQADEVFTPDCDAIFNAPGISFTLFSANTAAEALRGLAFNGKIDWKSAVEKCQPELLDMLQPDYDDCPETSEDEE